MVLEQERREEEDISFLKLKVGGGKRRERERGHIREEEQAKDPAVEPAQL